MAGNYAPRNNAVATVENRPVYLYHFVMGRWVLYMTYQGHPSNSQAAANYYYAHVGDEWYYCCDMEFWRIKAVPGVGCTTYAIPAFPEDAEELTDEQVMYWADYDESIRNM